MVPFNKNNWIGWEFLFRRLLFTWKNTFISQHVSENRNGSDNA